MPDEVTREQYRATRNSYHAAKRRVQYPESFADKVPATMIARWWVSFSSFIEDMGVRPANHILCRINQTLPYDKENCAWLPLDECRRKQGMCTGNVSKQGLPPGMVASDGVVRAAATAAEAEPTDVWVEEAAAISDTDFAEVEIRTHAADEPIVLGKEMHGDTHIAAQPARIDLDDESYDHDSDMSSAPVQVADDDDLDDLFEDFNPFEEDVSRGDEEDDDANNNT